MAKTGLTLNYATVSLESYTRWLGCKNWLKLALTVAMLAQGLKPELEALVGWGENVKPLLRAVRVGFTFLT